MPNARRTFTAAEELELTTQVGGYCPKCGAPLFYRKKTVSYRGYELAHIYPLNPKPAELLELSTVQRLHTDPNNIDNIIPLCVACHTQFDKPRTADEYNTLADIKRRCILRASQRAINRAFPLDQEVAALVARLNSAAVMYPHDAELDLIPKRLEDKFDPSLPTLLRRKITNAVTDYYQRIRRDFRELERLSPTISDLILSQVKTYYLQQKQLKHSQADIFHHVVDWILLAAAPATTEAAEVVASYFVQNCEVFD